MAVYESNMAEFKMAAIIKMSQNEWVKFFLCKMAESKMADFKMAEFKMVAIIKLIRLNQFESEYEWRENVFEWISEKKTRCLNPIWQNSRWLLSSIWVRMHEWIFFCANGWIQDGRNQYDYHHQGKSEWISLSGNELVWVRVLSKMAESKMAELKMAAIIKLSEND